MFPNCAIMIRVNRSLPHAGGGVSDVQCNRRLRWLSSPRRWGCFLVFQPNPRNGGVFPTQVGVFPMPTPFIGRAQRLPHAGGGVSELIIDVEDTEQSSPRRWGCFQTAAIIAAHHPVFPTQVGVFLQTRLDIAIQRRLPHAGGGVSVKHDGCHPYSWSSPRRWGCFQSGDGVFQCVHVFPTQVGVFLPAPLTVSVINCLPHAGGSVSTQITQRGNRAMSSPRRWGCFLKNSTNGEKHEVFPTQVGVFPKFRHTF